MKAKDNKLRLKFPDGWLEQHALTFADLEQEKKYLDTADITLEFN